MINDVVMKLSCLNQILNIEKMSSERENEKYWFIYTFFPLSYRKSTKKVLLLQCITDKNSD
jgi:hypothetical protein